jgi:hypothetical protein
MWSASYYSLRRPAASSYLRHRGMPQLSGRHHRYDAAPRRTSTTPSCASTDRFHSWRTGTGRIVVTFTCHHEWRQAGRNVPTLRRRPWKEHTPVTLKPIEFSVGTGERMIDVSCVLRTVPEYLRQPASGNNLYCFVLRRPRSSPISLGCLPVPPDRRASTF